MDDDGLDTAPGSINAFDAQGHYTGYLISQYGGVLSIRSALHQPDKDHLTAVDWILSLKAIPGAKHLQNRMLTPWAEKTLAEEMKSNSI